MSIMIVKHQTQMPFVNGLHDDGRQMMAPDNFQKVCDVLSIRKTSVYIEKIENCRVPSGKSRMHSFNGRHYDDRKRNAAVVFRKA